MHLLVNQKKNTLRRSSSFMYMYSKMKISMRYNTRYRKDCLMKTPSIHQDSKSYQKSIDTMEYIFYCHLSILTRVYILIQFTLLSSLLNFL